jgi:hypothetical protein
LNPLSRGITLGQLGRYAEAREASRKGQARMDKRVAAVPADHDARRDAAKLQTDVGWASLKLGETATALADLQAAIDKRLALSTADPADRRVAALRVTARGLLAEALAATPATKAAARRQVMLAITHQQAAPVARVLAGPGSSRARAGGTADSKAGAANARISAESCRHLQDALALWTQLQDSQRLRHADQPQLDAARAGAGLQRAPALARHRCDAGRRQAGWKL